MFQARRAAALDLLLLTAFERICTGTALLLLASSIWSAKARAQTSTVEQARRLAAAGRLEEANEVLSGAVQQHPADLAAWQELGEVQLEQRLDTDAMHSFEAVLSREPDAPGAQEGEVRAAIADALLSRKAEDQDGALRSLLRARKFVPESPQLLMDFGIQADSMRIFKDADAALSKAHTLAPENLEILYALAHVELDEQHTVQAEAHLREYLRARPQDATAHYGLGQLLHMISRDQDAKSELERSITLQPKQTESYYLLGEISLDSHDDAVARQQYERVLAANPNHAGALTGMGILAYRARDYALADTYLAHAVLCAPDYVTARRYYAMALARLGRQEQSKEEAAVAQELTNQQSKLSHGFLLVQNP